MKLNKALPWLVGNVVELLDAPEEDQEEQVRNAVAVLISRGPGGAGADPLSVHLFVSSARWMPATTNARA